MSSENPFNQPPANYFPYPQQVPVAYRLDLGKLFGDTWNLYKKNFGKMVVVGSIVIGISVCLGILLAVPDIILEQHDDLRYVSIALEILNQLITNLLSVWLYLGALQFTLSIARGYAPRYSMMFPALGNTLKGFGAAVMMCIIVWLPILFVGGIMASAWFFWKNPDDSGMTLIIISVLLGLVCLLYSIYMTHRLVLAFSFIADRNDGVFTSLGNSWSLMRGNVLMLLIATLVFSICVVSGMLLCCVGIILTYAVTPLGMALAYLQITGQPNICDYQRSVQPNPMNTSNTADMRYYTN